MPPNGFNPFDLVDDLKKSGFPQKQAESLAKVFAEVESKNAATKQDLEITKLELKQDIELVKKDIKELELKIKASQHIQTFQIIGAIAGLLAIFKFLPKFL